MDGTEKILQMNRKQLAIFIGLILIVVLIALALLYTAAFILVEQSLKVGFLSIAYWILLVYMIWRFQQIRSI